MPWSWRRTIDPSLGCLSANGNMAIGIGRREHSIRMFSLADDEIGAQGRNDHAAPITATACSARSNVACTCSSDALIFWNLDPRKPSFRNNGLNVGRFLPLAASRSIKFANFSSSGNVLGIVDESGCILLLDIGSGAILQSLRYKSASSCLFLDNIFIAISEDGTFRIWAGEAYSDLIYQSSVLCASRLITICGHPHLPRFTIASCNGYIFVFEYTEQDGCRYMGRINILEMLERIDNASAEPELDLIDTETLVMSTYLIGLSWNVVRDMSLLTAVTSTHVCIIHADSLDLVERFSVEVPESCCIVPFQESVFCFLTFAFSNQTSLLEFNISELAKRRQIDMSLFTNSELPDGSPLLKSAFVKKPKVASKNKSLDKPILFHKKVRSSGYGAPASKTNYNHSFHKSGMKSKPTTKRKQPKPPPNPSSAIDYRRIERIQVLEGERPIHNGPINAMSFARHGNSFLSCSTDSCVRIHRLKSGTSQILTGHTSNVKTAHWSSDAKLILTASADRTAAVYELPRLDPSCRVTHCNTNLSSKASQENSPFPAEINNALFFHKDEFIALCCRNDISLFKYKLGTASSELNRPYQDYKFLRVAAYRHDTETNGTITAIASHNSYKSHSVVASTRNRDILFVDMATGGSLNRVICNAHDRPIHSICLGGSSVDHGDIFCTAAADNTVRLWDVRQQGPVRRFVGHLNRQKQVGLALSPCSRFIVAGSEDQQIYTYDLTSGRWITRLRCQRDVISALSYCPTAPFLVSGAYDGSISCYTA